MFVYLRSINTIIYSLTEAHSLVTSEESHKLWHLDNFDMSTFVNIKMSPSFGPVSIEIFRKFFSLKSLMSFKDFLGSSCSSGLSHPECASWTAIIIFTFIGIVWNHRSHENIIRITREVIWNYSIITVLSISSNWGHSTWNWWFYLCLYLLFFIITIRFWVWLIS